MLVAVGGLGCVSTNGERAAGPKPPGAVAGAEARSSEGSAGQWLFRAEISGEEGSASLRLLLRRLDADHFTLVASDALGQSRWEIRRAGDRAVWIDPTAQRFCHLDPLRPLRARLSVPSIPVSDFPGLLTGDWPPASAVRAAADSTEAALEAFSPERPFTGEGAAGERAAGASFRWASWTLWEGSEPVAWYKRLGQDSLLSVRRPAVQVRWRVTAATALEPEPRATRDDRPAEAGPWPGDLPSGAREMACPENAIP